MATTPNKAPDKKKIGFRDVRDTAELLASGRLPKTLTYTLKNPFPPKLRAMVAKAKNAGQKALAQTAIPTSATVPTAGAAAKDIGKYALRGAAQVAAGVAAQKLMGVVSGKLGKVAGKASAAMGKIQQMAALFAMGANIVEELDPRKIEWPPRPGPAIDPVLIGAAMAETAARGVALSLLTNIPVGSGLPMPFAPFRTLDKLKSSLRFFDPKNPVVRPRQPDNASGQAIPRVNPQRGLLEDEIAYRLTLLAENVYEPMARYCDSAGLGKLTILEGFRSENSGVSPHERGEAIDVTLPSVDNLFRLAVWARDAVIYDQLILCHSDVGTGQSWLHASFTPDGRRREVLTKTFNDTFTPGLHIYGSYTDPAILSADKRKAEELKKAADSVTQILNEREARLTPIGVNTIEHNIGVAGFAGGGGGGAKCLSNPSIPSGPTTYDPGQIPDGAYSAIMENMAAMLKEEKWYEMAQGDDPALMVELVRRVGRSDVSTNARRGTGPTSADAVAIKNPTGAKNFGKWEDRISIIDIIVGHGGPDPREAWIDQTDLCDNGGGFGG